MVRKSLIEEPPELRRAAPSELAGTGGSKKIIATKVPESEVATFTVEVKNSTDGINKLLDLQRRKQPVDLVSAVSAGLRLAAVEKIAAALEMAPGDFASRYLDISPSTLSRRKKSGHLTLQESDRAVRYAQLISQAAELHEGDWLAASQWLKTPLAALGGNTPLEYSRTAIGYREVENLIVALEHGMFS